MTVVTTEVKYDTRGVANRISRKNSKDKLAWALAKIADLSAPECEAESPLDDIETIINRVVWGYD